MEDKELIDGLKSGDAKSIGKIYEQCFPKVRSLVINNSGSEVVKTHLSEGQKLLDIRLKVEHF